MAKEFTEDDTFRMLSRANFNEVRLAVRVANRHGGGSSRTTQAIIDLGWTETEYMAKLASFFKNESDNHAK